ncbi:MAG: peptide ABC transporter substrate-binding protein [Chloroflexi bacterium]|nr:peptide ABC transporter substrate-binding protein [Chloroflexota bacterium]
MKKVFRSLPAVVIILMFTATLFPTGLVGAGVADIILISVMQPPPPPNTYYLTENTLLGTLDPQRASDPISIDAVENLFLGLTDTDPLTPGSFMPELATDWEVNEDGTQWTFTIRTDVPWVRWNPDTETAEIVRMVTADDIAFGIQRACDPRLGNYYASVAARVILGCDALAQSSPDDVSDADYEQVQVSAPDDATLIVNLQFAASYFFSQTAMWIYRPVPRDAVEEFGDDWTALGSLMTNGPFVLDEYVRGVRRTFLRNPHLPDDLRGPGNVERVFVVVVEDDSTRFALYQDNQIDRSQIPPAEMEGVLNNPAYQGQLFRLPTLAVRFFGFANDRPPFDNVHVRRAFSAALDRSGMVQAVQQNRGIPMIHLTPPGIFGAPPINEVGVGYDPGYARAELEAAGYPNCEGLPPVNIVTYAQGGDWGEFLAGSVQQVLGCDAELLSINSQEFSVLLEATGAGSSDDARPHLWASSWGPDYPDAHNWVGDVLSCAGENSFRRPCSPVDDLIAEAALESNPDNRLELYYRIEEMFFGAEGEHPIIPLWLEFETVLFKPWVEGPFGTDALFGGDHYDWYNVDQAAQLAARD